MKIAASFSMGRLAPKHNLNIDGIRKLSPNVTPALIKDDVVIVDNLRTGSGTYLSIDDYKYKMTILKAALDSLTNDSEPKEISEEIIDAFISKIVVYPDRLDWYLRFSPDPEKPIGCNVTGSKRRGDTPSFAYCNTGCHR